MTLPAQRAAPGAPGYLGQHLEGPLGSPVIRQVQPHVCQHHAHQGDQGQVQALGEHLGADQHIGAVGAEVAQNDLVCAFLAGGLIIPAQGARLRQESLNFGFNLFGAGAVLADALAAALRAGRWAFCAGSRSGGR